MGCTCEFTIVKGEPVLINDEIVTAHAKTFASELLGYRNVHRLEPLMTSEDFAHFTHLFPCTYYRLGVRAKGIQSPHPQHSSRFMVDDEALFTGASLMTWLTMRFLLHKAEVGTLATEPGFDLYEPIYQKQ